MKNRFLIFIYISLSLLIFSCGSNEKNIPHEFDYGQIENNHYINSFFGLDLELPTGWIIQSKKQNENFIKNGKELIAGNDKKMKSIIKDVEVKSTFLLTMFKNEIGSAVDFNPSFSLIAENLENSPGIKKGHDYLFHARKLMEYSQLKYDSIDNKFDKIIINNQEFFKMNCYLNLIGQNIIQSYYATVINNFCLVAIITYTKNEKSELEKIINSIKFN